MSMISIRFKSHVFGPLAQQKIDRREYDQQNEPHGPARAAPAGMLDHVLNPWQQRHRADADARECDTHRQSAPANKPVGQEQRLSGIPETHASAADHHANRQIQMPWLRGQRRQQ